MKFFDNLKKEVKESKKKKKFDEAKSNVKNNLTQENRNNLRYLFASFFGIAALMALAVGFYKLFFAYFIVGASLLPILYHNRLTEDIDYRIIRFFEILMPIVMLLIIAII